jgi:hypothetical protein
MAKQTKTVATKKTLSNSDVNGTKKNVPDVKIFGNGDLFQLLVKASSEKEGWMKSTKAMQVSGGCVIQATTQQKNKDGSYSVAEALTFVPNVTIAETYDADGIVVARNLIPITGIIGSIKNKIKKIFNTEIPFIEKIKVKVNR